MRDINMTTFWICGYARNSVANPIYASFGIVEQQIQQKTHKDKTNKEKKPQTPPKKNKHKTKNDRICFTLCKLKSLQLWTFLLIFTCICTCTYVCIHIYTVLLLKDVFWISVIFQTESFISETKRLGSTYRVQYYWVTLAIKIGRTLNIIQRPMSQH